MDPAEIELAIFRHRERMEALARQRQVYTPFEEVENARMREQAAALEAELARRQAAPRPAALEAAPAPRRRWSWPWRR